MPLLGAVIRVSPRSDQTLMPRVPQFSRNLLFHMFLFNLLTDLLMLLLRSLRQIKGKVRTLKNLSYPSEDPVPSNVTETVSAAG